MTTSSPIRIAFLLFPNVTQLDLTGPVQVLSRLGNARLDLVWKTLEPVQTDAGFAILPTATLADVDRADILCVPGGFGTHRAIADDATIDWVARVGADARWVTSGCTGSLVLGAAGLLRGYKAGCHWAQRHMLPLFGAEPVAERVRVANELRSTGSAESEKIRADADRQRTVILAEAFREAEKIKGEGDAKASAIYSDAFGKNPEFYKFYRSLEAYRASFKAQGDVMVIDSNSEYFKYFKNPGSK